MFVQVLSHVAYSKWRNEVMAISIESADSLQMEKRQWKTEKPGA